MTLSASPTAQSGGEAGDINISAAARWRSFLAIDGKEAFIEGAQRTSGLMLITLTAMLAVVPHFGFGAAAWAIGAAMAAAIRPNWRNPILFLATWTATFTGTALGDTDTLDNIMAVMQKEGAAGLSPVALASAFLLLLMISSAGLLYWIRQSPQSLLARRPLVTLLTFEALLCALANLDFMQGLPRIVLWSAIFVLTPYIWFLPYAIVDLRSRAPSSLLLNMAAQRPFWSPSYLPFGKGAAFLRKHLAQNPRDLAITHLKAVKLLIWANVLFGIKFALNWAFGEQLGLPTVDQAINDFLGGHPYPLQTGWAALTLSTAKFSLQIAIWAHLFIGIARLAGYRLPRGSWRPLESQTLMDYFNRFHYYFKEFLVDFFFIPTFFKIFRKHPQLRMFFATFMAAGVGNAIWHFVRDIDIVATQGAATALETFISYAFYCAVLATGVGLSQVRVNMGIRPSPTLAGRLYSFFFVWSFVVCMHVFSDGSRNHTLGERLSFLASLFGVI